MSNNTKPPPPGSTDDRAKRRRGPDADPRIAGYTVADVARRYRVSPDRVRAWIDRGELPAINRRDTSAGRPAYVITPDALAEFECGRAGAPEPKPTRRRKRRTQQVDFYPD